MNKQINKYNKKEIFLINLKKFLFSIISIHINIKYIIDKFTLIYSNIVIIFIIILFQYINIILNYISYKIECEYDLLCNLNNYKQFFPIQ